VILGTSPAALNRTLGLVILILWHPLRPPLDEIQRQSDGEDCELLNQEFFPTPFGQKPPIASLDNRRVGMPIPPDDSYLIKVAVVVGQWRRIEALAKPNGDN
jgi:hypothetical protein